MRNRRTTYDSPGPCTPRNLEVVDTSIFACLNIFFVLIILSQGAPQFLVDWKKALYSIVAPCVLNIFFAFCWMIGAAMRRSNLIAMFRYFTYVQMTLLGGIILYSAYYSHVTGITSSLATVIAILIAVFILSLIEVFIAIRTERSIAKDREALRIMHLGQEMTHWSHS